MKVEVNSIERFKKCNCKYCSELEKCIKADFKKILKCIEKKEVSD